MTGTFACPECGTLLSTHAHTAGVRVRCVECSTLVEVPFLPRHVSPRRRRAKTLGWMIAGGGTLVAVLMVILAVSLARGRGQANRLASLQSHLTRARAAEREGDWEQAVNQSEEAMKVAARLAPCEQVDEALAVHDRIALLAVRSQLNQARGETDPISTLRALRSRIDTELALEPAREEVTAELAQALGRVAQADLAEAAKAMDQGRSSEALLRCEHVAELGDELGAEHGGKLRASAREVAREIVARAGVVMGPVTGEFLRGPSGARDHADGLHPILIEALKRSGYLPKPARTAFATAWDSAAPYTVDLEIIEREEGTFFQTPLHTSRINAHVVLRKGGSAIWQARFQGRTRVPPPTMSAFESSRLSLAKSREPEVEKRLYEDARQVLADNLGQALKNLPRP